MPKRQALAARTRPGGARQGGGQNHGQRRHEHDGLPGREDVPGREDDADGQDKEEKRTVLQLILDTFARALLTASDHIPAAAAASEQLRASAFKRLDPASLPPLLQSLKRDLYARDFLAAFTGTLSSTVTTDGGAAIAQDASLESSVPAANNTLEAATVHSGARLAQDRLTAYAARWSASRAMAYWELMFAHLRLQSHITEVHAVATQHQTSRVVCIGGGAGAELVALTTELCRMGVSGEKATPAVEVVLLDIAPGWGAVLEQLLRDTPFTYTSLGSTAMTQGCQGDNIDHLSATFVCRDVLEDDQPRELTMQTILAPALTDDRSPTQKTTVLVTIMFTLNELFSTSMSRTVHFILCLTDSLQPGALLLVVDSPGSYSTVQVGKASQGSEATKRQYPMQWLLDHTLLESASADAAPHDGDNNTSAGSRKTRQQRWEKLEGCESRWFRSDVVKSGNDGQNANGSRLQYPVKLEDMRYQMHLYRRV